jgi:sRNA-binding protein
LKTKGEFQNLFIDKVYAAGDTVEGETDVAEAEAPAEAEEEAEPEAEAETEEEEEKEEEEEDADADTVDIQPGMTVIVDSSKGKVKGEVIELLEAEGKVRVKTEDGRVLRVGGDKLQAVVDAAPPEPKVAPKKGKAKK